jgi:hypothetical protein
MKEETEVSRPEIERAERERYQRIELESLKGTKHCPGVYVLSKIFMNDQKIA